MKKLLVICIALSVLFLLVAVVAADDMGKAQTVNGWVSDSKCGAKGANAGAAACTKKCIDGGASAVVVTDGDNKVLAVDNADALASALRHLMENPQERERLAAGARAVTFPSWREQAERFARVLQSLA